LVAWLRGAKCGSAVRLDERRDQAQALSIHRQILIREEMPALPKSGIGSELTAYSGPRLADFAHAEDPHPLSDRHLLHAGGASARPYHSFLAGRGTRRWTHACVVPEYAGVANALGRCSGERRGRVAPPPFAPSRRRLIKCSGTDAFETTGIFSRTRRAFARGFAEREARRKRRGGGVGRTGDPASRKSRWCPPPDTGATCSSRAP
jgi:hypothetical protein